MMQQFQIISPLKGVSFQTALDHFGKDLLLYLTPKFPKATLMQYEGNQPGQQVVVEIDFILFKDTWTSTITELESSTDNWYFVDESQAPNTPFFLSKWCHKHIIRQVNGQVEIVDDISFEAKFPFPNVLIGMMLKAQFAQRKPLYQAYFEQLNARV